MIDLKNIHPLSHFQRHTKEHLRRLKASKNPQVLTLNGRPVVVVQDAEAYQDLLNAVARAQAIEGIQRGLDSMTSGRGKPASKAIAELRKKHNIPRR